MIGDREFSAQGLFVLIVAKHRNGELGEIPLKFVGEQAKITNLDEGFSNNSSTFVQQKPEPMNLQGFLDENKPKTDNKNDSFDNDLGSVNEVPF
jgi:hypothetical protein